MSGGSYDYICYKIKDLEREIEGQITNPRRAAFAKLMGLIGEAMYKIEWVDSGDNSPGDENDSIDNVFSFLSVNPQLIWKARAYDSLKNILEEHFKITKNRTDEYEEYN